MKDKLIVGIAGGEFATRGFLDAYSRDDGKRLWRFWTIPAPGEPGSDTWPAGHFERGGGATWITGSYDPELNLALLGRRQSRSRFLRRQSPGRQPLHRIGRRARRRHRQAALALPVHAARRARLGLEPDPGARRPDDRRPPAEDADHREPQRLLLRARSRPTASSFRQAVREDDVGHGLDAKGRPIEIAEPAADAGGHADLPRLAGGTSFTSPSFDPARRCSSSRRARPARCTCRAAARELPARSMVMGGGTRNRGGTGALRAIDPVTMETKWEVPVRRTVVQRRAVHGQRARVRRRRRGHADGRPRGHRPGAVEARDARHVLGRAEHASWWTAASSC